MHRLTKTPPPLKELEEEEKERERKKERQKSEEKQAGESSLRGFGGEAVMQLLQMVATFNRAMAFSFRVELTEFCRKLMSISTAISAVPTTTVMPSSRGAALSFQMDTSPTTTSPHSLP